MNYCIIKSLVGDLMLVADTSVLTGLYFESSQQVPAVSKRGTLNAGHPVLEKTAKQLKEYFEGKRTSFSLPLHLAGTDFQEQIWQQIALIPYGKIISYGELAKWAGAPQAIRAAGTATGQNPVSIIIPCHRVMGKNGRMCGFAGGLERKRLLLELEKRDYSRPLGSPLSASLSGAYWSNFGRAGSM